MIAKSLHNTVLFFYFKVKKVAVFLIDLRMFVIVLLLEKQ